MNRFKITNTYSEDLHKKEILLEGEVLEGKLRLGEHFCQSPYEPFQNQYVTLIEMSPGTHNSFKTTPDVMTLKVRWHGQKPHFIQTNACIETP